VGILYNIVANEFVFLKMSFFEALIEYRQPLDLLEQPSIMEIGLCWYQNKNTSM
jgi:hypothetical protein